MNFDRWTYGAAMLAVHDGDTVRVELDLGFGMRFDDAPLRLLGVQAPEVAGPDVTDAEKAAGAAARDYLTWLLGEAGPLKGGTLYARTVKDKTEGRGRYLATLLVELGNGNVVDVNARLLSDGHAIAAPLDGSKVPKWVGLDAATGGYRWRRADGSEVVTPPPKRPS